jgi:periplasmic divalent cation tolerance protein
VAPDSAVQVQFTIDDGDRGDAIAGSLLRDGLVSCVQRLGPMRSRYRWQGSIDESTEWLFVCKTTTARAHEVVARVAAQHPYDTPEVLVTEIAGGLDRYLAWNAAETSPPTGA